MHNVRDQKGNIPIFDWMFTWATWLLRNLLQTHTSQSTVFSS